MTPKQQEVFQAIRSHIRRTGQSPTVREICDVVGLSSPCSVHMHLNTLERLGKIRRSKFKYRSIELVGEEDAPKTSERDRREAPALPSPTVFVPLLGQAAGGGPITATQDPDPELMAIPASFLARGEADWQSSAVSSGAFWEGPLFAFTVKGDSMEGVGISDGDLVVARKQKTARDGDIVVALLEAGTEESEATVKRFFHDGAAVRLEPENPAYSALVTKNVEIMGKVALSIKRF